MLALTVVLDLTFASMVSTLGLHKLVLNKTWKTDDDIYNGYDDQG